MAEGGGGSQENVLRILVERRGKEERRKFQREQREKEAEQKGRLGTKRGRGGKKKESLLRGLISHHIRPTHT